MSGLRPGVRVVATDAFGNDHHGVVTRGPTIKPGVFLKVWLRIDGRDDEIPWPVSDVRPDAAATTPDAGSGTSP